MKRLAALLLVLCMIFSLCACGGSKPAEPAAPDTTPAESESSTPADAGEDKAPATDKDTLVASFVSDRGTLDPLYYSGFDIQNVMALVYEPLWAWDNAGNQIFKLATACDMVEPTVWRVSLREGVKFSNGNDFTADDVIFTMNMANNRVGEAPYLPELDLENTKAIDDHTVELVFYHYDCTYTGTMGTLFMYDAESYDANTISSVAIGTGPYVVDEYVVNSHLNLVANDGYWGDEVAIKDIEFKLIAEDSQKTNELAAESIDLSSVPFQDIEYIKSLGSYQVVTQDMGETKAIYFNTSEKSIFHDNELARQAVAHAIDRDAIVDIAYSGYASVSQMPCATSNMDATDEMKNLGVYKDGYDVELATQLAKDSGLYGQTVSFCTDGSSTAIATAECVQSDLAAIGVNVEIKNYDAGTWMSVLFDPNEAGDMMLYMVVMPSHSVSACMSAWYSYGLGGTFVMNPFPEKETYDSLVEGILTISDPVELNRRNVELCRIMSESVLWFGLVDTQSATAVRNGLEGYHTMLMSNIAYEDLYWTE